MSTGRAAPPTVVHLLATLDPGGVERAVLTLARHLDPSRFRNEVWHLTGPGSLAPAFAAAGVRVRRVPLLASWDLGVVPRLTWALRRSGARLLHTHHPEASAFGRMAARHSGLAGVVTTEHSVTHWSTPGTFVNRLVRATAADADRVVSVSKAVEYLSQGAGAALPGRSVVIHDGAPLPEHAADTPPLERRRRARACFGLQADGPVIASIGRLLPHKGIDVLIETMALVLSERSDAELVIAGAGAERAKLERLAAERGTADRIVFAGAVADPYDLLPAVDVLVLPSRTEGGGLAALEAMAHGVPVVATQVGGLPDHMESGDGGLLVAPNAPNEIAAVVLYLLNSALYAAEVGGTGKRKIASGGPGSARHMADRYARLYDELLTRL